MVRLVRLWTDWTVFLKKYKGDEHEMVTRLRKRQNIKMKSDGPRYRLAYDCGACGETGRHYVRANKAVVWCHTCQQPLIIEPATDKIGENGLPVPDRGGNFYKAHHVKTTG